MKFRVAIHAGSKAPEDALDRLIGRLGGEHEDVWFAKPGPVIDATWLTEAPVAMERDERMAVGRWKVWEIVEEVCEGIPDLSPTWFAVSPQL